MRVLRFPFDENLIPENGIYIMFGQNEKGHGSNRIVRVGTHTGQGQLRSRLKQHFLIENKDRSIFRKNIGRCILSKSKDSFFSQWELDLTSGTARRRYSGKVDFGKLRRVEKLVSRYIQRNFSFVVLPVKEKELRLHLESRIISTVSWCQECLPSDHWLGKFSPKNKIRESGLWLVNELYKEPLSQEDMKHIQKIIQASEC